ncbi:hypothetical protein MJO28_005775 [Puccinia striiformis f. sp. tritici]|nr:hypothetical protein Pst134EA_009870 [Puccinia striiformis f. sp. tritici]POW00439.1 hypothetical protein PSHT_12995 [Puccinia striiformis]KAH9469350.1 hypothetical protein Pst134EA_009870 [Puccinia striiformis f. sp. tritici]KAI7955375.1 hypothetical protein MJO28_005775 [Puccinia striiformis f. sp. tritici]KAI7960716.1 hypothetical protein MJO29_005784 [Puccinia striiformis f. sp. tritici]POW08680.1 hypothetical protein PSTT_07356 [Puccinia striiformis]
MQQAPLNPTLRLRAIGTFDGFKCPDLNEVATEEVSKESISCFGPIALTELPFSTSQLELRPDLPTGRHIGNSPDSLSPRKREGNVLAGKKVSFKPYSKKARLVIKKQKEPTHNKEARRQEEPPSTHINQPNGIDKKNKKPKDHHQIHEGTSQSQNEEKTNNVSPNVFNVYDWDYVREFSGHELISSRGDQQQEELTQLLASLNECKPLSQREDFFWIPREDAPRILRKFQKSGVGALHNFSRSSKRIALSEIVLRLSN